MTVSALDTNSPVESYKPLNPGPSSWRDIDPGLKYFVVKQPHARSLASVVTSMIEDGWMPQGGVAV